MGSWIWGTCKESWCLFLWFDVKNQEGKLSINESLFWKNISNNTKLYFYLLFLYCLTSFWVHLFPYSIPPTTFQPDNLIMKIRLPLQIFTFVMCWSRYLHLIDQMMPHLIINTVLASPTVVFIFAGIWLQMLTPDNGPGDASHSLPSCGVWADRLVSASNINQLISHILGNIGQILLYLTRQSWQFNPIFPTAIPIILTQT